MIEGYLDLNAKIAEIHDSISLVENASKEQYSGIKQINDSVNVLDQQTQENVVIANNTHEITKETGTISELIVENAAKKEFHGKEPVVSKVFNS